jgi:hypothetical protein
MSLHGMEGEARSGREIPLEGKDISQNSDPGNAVTGLPDPVVSKPSHFHLHSYQREPDLRP